MCLPFQRFGSANSNISTCRENYYRKYCTYCNNNKKNPKCVQNYTSMCCTTIVCKIYVKPEKVFQQRKLEFALICYVKRTEKKDEKNHVKIGDISIISRSNV